MGEGAPEGISEMQISAVPSNPKSVIGLRATVATVREARYLSETFTILSASFQNLCDRSRILPESSLLGLITNRVV